MRKFRNNSFEIASSMWEVMKQEIVADCANTREYFHAKEIFLNALSYLEGRNRTSESDKNRSDRDVEKEKDE